MNLLYFNKTEQDIWCKDELAAIAEKDERYIFIRLFLNDGIIPGQQLHSS